MPMYFPRLPVMWGWKRTEAADICAMGASGMSELRAIHLSLCSGYNSQMRGKRGPSLGGNKGIVFVGVNHDWVG